MTTIAPLRRVASMSYGDALAADEREEGAVPVMSSGGITGTHDQPNTLAPAIVVGRKGSHGSVWWSETPAFVIDTAYSIDRSNTTAHLRWLYYVLQSLGLGQLSNDVGVPGLSREAAYEALVTVVPIDEQRRIADFLDDRVARIDQIIAARREQFALVEEAQHESMRVATEGRDRGASWSRPRVAHIFRTGSGSTPPSDRLDYYDGDVPWVNTGDVRDDLLSTTGRTLTRGALADFSTLVRYPVGSMVIAMYGQGATKGRTALLQTTACVNQACCVLQGDPLLLRWAFQWFRAHKADIVELANGAGQPNLSQEIIRNVRLAVPPRDAVEGLLLEIESQQTASAGTRAFVTRQISLLQEYKESLITAAVTGELDVTTAGSEIPG